MEPLLLKKKILKGKVTRIKNIVARITTSENVSKPEFENYYEQACNLWQEANVLNDQVLGTCEDDDYDNYSSEFLELFDSLDASKIALKGLIQPEVSIERPSQLVGESSTLKQASVTLPRIDLPVFQGKFENWLYFHDLFLATIHNNDSISKAQKLQYLKLCTKGDAATLIQAIQINDSNYDIAWEILCNRYENKIELIYAHLDKLFNQAQLQQESAPGLRKILDITSECIDTLRTLKQPVEHWDCFLVYWIRKKLDPETLRQWELAQVDDKLRSLAEFKVFLDTRARALATLGISKPKLQANTKQTKAYVPAKSHSATHLVSSKRSCFICEGEHTIYTCQDFLSNNVASRRDLAKKHSLCFNCLRRGHSYLKCTVKTTCKKCKSHHHSLLHEDQESKMVIQEDKQDTISSYVSKDNVTSLSVLLPTAIIRAFDIHGNPQPCRALIDCGSQTCFLREDCAQRLGLRRKQVNVTVAGLSSNTIGNVKGEVQMQIASFSDPDVSLQINALILPKITNELPQQLVDPSSLKSFRQLKLADPQCMQPGPIDILLGADIFAEIILPGRQKASNGSLYALESQFGWILSGRVELSTSLKSAHKVTTHHASCTVDSVLEKFWEIEEVPHVSAFTQEETLCEEHFMKHHFRDETGRYCVKLPIRNTNLQLGSSREHAVQRLKQIERLFSNQPEHAALYKGFMQEYLNLGHMELIPHQEHELPTNQVYYIPHHAVLNKKKPVSKFRVVFDASRKSSTGASLNDILMVGPTIQDGLIPLVLRFRTHQIALIGDIVKMYRQIRVHQDDINLQRILWRESTNAPIQEYRLLTVTYGTSSAPYLATKCLQQLGKDEAESFPKTSIIIQRDFYVDDLMTGADTMEEVVQIQQEIIQILKRGGFEIKKWASNKINILEVMSSNSRENNIPLKIDNDEAVKALGILWHPISDSFSFQVNFSLDTKMTKRSLLSNIAKIFDPMGWLSPVVIQFKIFMQQLWKLKLDWDDELPQFIQDEWLLLCKDLSNIESIKIPRCIIVSQAIHCELHGFCDASEKAYGAVVYLRSLTKDNDIAVQMITSKTKVAPLKVISLPRLELCAALILSKLIVFVQQTISFKWDIEMSNIHCYTDSSIVLSWLASCPSRWKTFVANRVTKIQSSVPTERWHHVKSEINPADCSSRGISASTLKSSSLWWTGPEMLYEPNIQFDDISHESPQTQLPEEKLSSTYNVSMSEVSPVKIDDKPFLISRFSSLSHLKRVTAYCRRFINNSRNSQNRMTGFLTTQELEDALTCLVRIAQRSEFSEEMNCLSKQKPLPSKSRVLSLNPFLDNSGILRVGGRLKHSNAHHDQKHPMLIPRRHPLTELLLANFHLCNLHAGPQLMHSLIQCKFWIINARDIIRQHVKKCTVCCRFQARVASQMMGDLPRNRVTPSRPFLQCGVDYAGPFLLRASKVRGQKSFKGYISLFICFVTRAIHLELVSDLTTSAFIAALKRFIARRGKCQNIYSDCGSNFIGAQRELKEVKNFLQSDIHNKNVSHYLTDEGINWHFNPPASPHIGGIWEAGVKSVKYHLRRIIGETSLTYEEMYTILVQVEACLNSRPLCPISSDPNDLSALTPGHFLVGGPLTAVPEVDHTSIAENRLNRWQLLQKLFQHFWKRWSSEYLVRLQQRPKWLVKEENLKVGSLVLLKDERLPPLKWRLGRIIELFPGTDDCVRVVSIKTIDGLQKRSITKLCPLPID